MLEKFNTGSEKLDEILVAERRSLGKRGLGYIKKKGKAKDWSPTIFVKATINTSCGECSNRSVLIHVKNKVNSKHIIIRHYCGCPSTLGQYTFKMLHDLRWKQAVTGLVPTAPTLLEVRGEFDSIVIILHIATSLVARVYLGILITKHHSIERSVNTATSSGVIVASSHRK